MTFFKQISHTFFTNIFMMFLQMGTSILVARSLGPTLNGRVALLLTIPTFLFMLGNVGLGSAFSFYTARKEYPLHDILNAAVFCTAGLSAIMIGIFFLSYSFHRAVWENIEWAWLVVAVLLTPIDILVNFIHRITLGRQKIFLVNTATMIAGIVKLVVIILCIQLNYKMSGIIIAYGIAQFLNILILVGALRKDVKLAPLNVQLLRASFRYGSKVYLLLLINYLNLRTSMYLVKYFTQNDTEVGLYSIAVSLAEMMWLLPEAIVLVLFPTIAASAREKERESIFRTINSICSTMVVMVVGALGLVLFAKIALQLVYGVEYLPSYRPMLYLLPGIMLYPIFKMVNVDLGARGFPEYGTIVSFIGFILNTSANIALIPRYGIIGSALAASLSYSCMSVVSLYFFTRVTKVTLTDFFFSFHELFVRTLPNIIQRITVRR